MTLHAQEYWRQRFPADREQLEKTRQEGLAQASKAAEAMRERWPQIRAVHPFGSVLDDHRFRSHSDLALLVEGLPLTALLDAIALAEDSGTLLVDMKRREDLSEDLVQRLLRISQTL
ncbi:MAG: hypothetical protein ED554_06775 [Synechococcus sp. YX04-3]|nr:MAG: hypothetical protein ED554_06775 [Synechococcus sp. YX04-3]